MDELDDVETVRVIRPGPGRCGACRFSGAIAEFPLVDGQFTCPKCKAGEERLAFHPSAANYLAKIKGRQN